MLFSDENTYTGQSSDPFTDIGGIIKLILGTHLFLKKIFLETKKVTHMHNHFQKEITPAVAALWLEALATKKIHTT